jgi:hypothetical protein
MRNTTEEGMISAVDCFCIRGKKLASVPGDDACAENEDFILENGQLGLPLCVPKAANASADLASAGRRRGGTTYPDVPPL